MVVALGVPAQPLVGQPRVSFLFNSSLRILHSKVKPSFQTILILPCLRNSTSASLRSHLVRRSGTVKAWNTFLGLALYRYLCLITNLTGFPRSGWWETIFRPILGSLPVSQ